MHFFEIPESVVTRANMPGSPVNSRCLSASLCRDSSGDLNLVLTPQHDGGRRHPIINCWINIQREPWSITSIRNDVCREAPEHKAWGTIMMDAACELLGGGDIIWVNTSLSVGSEAFWVKYARTHSLKDIRHIDNPSSVRSELTKAKIRLKEGKIVD